MTLLTEIKEGLRISWSAIRANKLRSGLSMMGIITGIVTVSLMATAIQGLNMAFMQSISALGSDVLYIDKFPWERDEEWWKFRNRRDFSISYADTIVREATEALAVSAEASNNRTVKYKDRSASGVWICGNNAQSAIVRKLTVREGRFFSEEEVKGARPVCVLGAEVAEKFFPFESPLGKKIKVAETTFEVVGVLERFGKFLFANMDNQVIVPITKFVTEMSRRPYIFFMVKVRDVMKMDEAREELRGIMRKVRRVPPAEPDDFAINQQEMLVKRFQRVGGTIATVGLFITGLSLFVGGIGLMNVMFVSVAERTKEIGIRKAIGAKRRTILIQFLIEAITICLLGGTAGLAIAFPASLAMKHFGGDFLPASMSLNVVALAIAVSLLTGIVAGMVPAYRAARMDPVDALRSE